MRMELLMSKVIVFTNLTLDGVMQAPADQMRTGVVASSMVAGLSPTPR
jgi:hypothetical protein